jgi:quercetin dioxygenase-like cupin family protein
MAVIHRSVGTGNDYLWQDVIPQGYDVPDISGVVKHVLIGPDDSAPNFIIRYFQIEPGGYSQLESHPQEHGILILHGQARIQLKDEILELNPLDVVFIPGGDEHQLMNVSKDIMGFICVIPS